MRLTTVSISRSSFLKVGVTFAFLPALRNLPNSHVILKMFKSSLTLTLVHGRPDMADSLGIAIFQPKLLPLNVLPK